MKKEEQPSVEQNKQTETKPEINQTQPPATTKGLNPPSLKLVEKKIESELIRVPGLASWFF